MIKFNLSKNKTHCVLSYVRVHWEREIGIEAKSDICINIETLTHDKKSKEPHNFTAPGVCVCALFFQSNCHSRWKFTERPTNLNTITNDWIDGITIFSVHFYSLFLSFQLAGILLGQLYDYLFFCFFVSSSFGKSNEILTTKHEFQQQ